MAAPMAPRPPEAVATPMPPPAPAAAASPFAAVEPAPAAAPAAAPLVPPAVPPAAPVEAPPARIPKPGAALPPAPPAVPQPLPAVPPSDLLLRQFLKGAGVSAELPPAELEQVMFTVGALFREMVEGLMTVLRARAEVKSQFRVAVTTIRAANNNPLKFTADAGDAIKLLLDPRHPGFIEPRRAVQEGMSDVMNHQLAMTAGIQAALADALRRFHPTVFEKPFEEGLVFQKKAKCWEAYVKSYPELANDVLENIFGDTFAEAYERQMQILKASGSDRGPGGMR
jgi:type VI secretion system FHA domain protein